MRQAHTSVEDVPSIASGRGDIRSLTDEAHQFLKWKILTMEIPPGTWLNERHLVESTGFTRAPIHQALHRLQSEGLVEIRPRKGAQVRIWTPQDIAHLMEARIPLELTVVSLACERAKQSELDALTAELAKGPQLLADMDREGLVRLDHTFHQSLAEFARNPVLGELVENVHHRSMLLWAVPLSGYQEYESVMAQHQEILGAITKRDPALATSAMKRHLSSFVSPDHRTTL